MKTSHHLRPVERRTLTDMVADQLIQYIQNDLNDGDRLPSERELMDMLQVGRSSVREALRALEMIGLIESRTGEGTFVTKSMSFLFKKPIEWGIFDNEQSLLELVEARRIFETAMVDLVVERITEEELDKLEVLVEQMEQVKPPNQELFLHADLRFHELFVKATRNEVLIETFNLSMRTLEKERGMSITRLADYQWIAAFHRKILEGLRNRDVLQAKEALKAHMKKTERLFKLHLKKKN